MDHESIFQMSARLPKDVLEQEVRRRKSSLNCILLNEGETWFTYDLATFSLVRIITEKVFELNFLFDQLNDFTKTQLLQSCLIKEMLSDFKVQFLSATPKTLFNYFIYGSPNSNKSIIDGYREIIEGKTRSIKTINDIRKYYESVILPRQMIHHRKTIKKFHYFRDEPLRIGDPSNRFDFIRGVDGETNIIKEMDQALFILNRLDLDPYSRSAIFFYLFLSSMPYYNDNYFFAKFLLSVFYENEVSPFLAVHLSQMIERYEEWFIKTVKETESKDNHGDLSHFVFAFLSILKDGLDFSLQEIKQKNKAFKNLTAKIQFKGSKSDKQIVEMLTQAKIYGSFGLSAQQIASQSKISMPTVNRCVKKLKDAGLLDITHLGKRDFLRIKE